MTISYDIYLGSGSADANHYSAGGNISLIEITNSDNEYFQNGVINAFDVTTNRLIGDKVLLFINDDLEFDGYISRIQQEIVQGKKTHIYQVVGRTYDLWRYHTSASAEYSGNTCYIASSLIADYCPGISGSHIWNNSGTTMTDSIDFSNTIVGDALIDLTKIDGFKFYIDNSGQMHYYQPEFRGDSYDFTISESDIFKMDPLEEADEDITNKVLVVGGTGYSTITSQPNLNHSFALTSNAVIAQRICAEDDILSAVKFYMDRTEDDDEPDTLIFSIFPDADSHVYTDEFEDYTYLNTSTKDNADIFTGGSDSFLTTTESSSKKLGQTGAGGAPQNDSTANYYIGWQVSGGGSSDIWKPFSFDARVTRVEAYVVHNDSYALPKTVWCYLISGCDKDISAAFASASTTMSAYYQHLHFDIPWSQRALVKSGQQFFVALHQPIASDGTWEFRPNTTSDTDFAIYTSADGTTWTKDSYSARRYQPTSYFVYGKNYDRTGNIKTTTFTQRAQYITISAQTYSGQHILLSGSLGLGWWSGLTNGIENDLGDEGSNVTIKYIFSSLNSTTFDASDPPYIENVTVSTKDSTYTAGMPAGTPIPWSNDISFIPSDLPYPSGWCEWQSYDSPKLKNLNVGANYWLVISGANDANPKKWELYYASNQRNYASGQILLKSGSSWLGYSDNNACPSGDLAFKLGWYEHEITATRTDDNSINSYGVQLRKIYDDSIVTQEMADERARIETSGSNIKPKKKGVITINGRTDIETDYRFSSNLTNFGIHDIFDIVSYTQRISDEEGFVTVINYGKQNFDIMKKLSDLEKKVYGG